METRWIKGLRGGSIADTITIWLRNVLVVSRLLRLGLAKNNAKGIVLKNVFTNIVRFLFGIRESKVYIYRLRQSSRKGYTIPQPLNLERDTNHLTQFKKDKESAQVLNLLVRKHLETETLNGVEMMLDMGLLTRGYIGIMDMRLPVKTGSKIY